MTPSFRQPPPKRFVPFIVSLLVLVFATASTRSAHAEERDVAVATEHHQHQQQPEPEPNAFRVRGFFEMGLGIRSLSLSGMTLKNHGATDGGGIVVSGNDLSTGFSGTMSVGGGLAVGPLLLGAEIGGGMGGSTRGNTFRAGDIDVRPTGFNALMADSVFLGLMYETRRVRYRLDGVLGYELDGIGMERPGFPDTSVSAVNAERWTLGPRLRVDFYRDDFAHVGIALGCNARDAKNVTFGVVASF